MQSAKNNTGSLLINALHVGTGSRSVPTRFRSFISSGMTYIVICCMSEKKVILQVTYDPLYDMI